MPVFDRRIIGPDAVVCVIKPAPPPLVATAHAAARTQVIYVGYVGSHLALSTS